MTAFAAWFNDLERHCERHRFLIAAALEKTLARQAENGTLDPLPATLVLCHLEDLTPAQQHLLNVLAKRGTHLVQAPISPFAHTGPPVLLQCDDADDEMRALTGFLREALQSPQRPDIAVIVPDLSSARSRLERALRERMSTVSDQPFREERQPLWEFATGQPLAATAVVADALCLLRWTVQELDSHELSTLLRSPYLRWPVSTENAALLDVRLLRRNASLLATRSPRGAASVLHQSHPELSADLLKRTASWPNLRKESAAFSTLAERARRILHDFGWPGVRPRTSVEFQAVRRWEDLLDSFAALDLVAPPTTWADFLDRIAAAARDTAFARENTGAPIQFLTPEESTGTEADYIWVLHADEARWSPRQHPHPLLPRPLQRTHGVPGSDHARDTAHLREQIGAIVRNAPCVTFSFAGQSAEGEQRPCGLIEMLPGIERRHNEGSSIVLELTAAAALQEFDDGVLIPLALQNPAVPVHGGVGILQSQAACAFRAFAEQRLGSTALESKDIGLDARDRGNRAHQALHQFWEDTKSSDGLHALIATGRLHDEIQRVVHRALPMQAGQQPWETSYLDLQRERLQSILRQWLEMESRRPAFRIAALEKESVVHIGPLPLKVRVDRIDEITLPNGETRRVIIDYKTGDQTAAKWEGDRPDEPQLPLYATADLSDLAEETPSPVGAVAFGIVRSGDKLRFQTLPQRCRLVRADVKTANTSLEPELENWRHTLQTLAEEFAAGIATVNPKEYPTTCRFCEQRLLCRLNPELLDDESEDEVDIA